MTNEQWLAQFEAGDLSALEKLCNKNTGLIYSRAKMIAASFHCIQTASPGRYTAYTKELLLDLVSVGTLALLGCIRSNRYNSEKGTFSTYVVPFLDGAMRRYMETSLGVFSLDRQTMALVRKAQMLYRTEWKDAGEIAEDLGISAVEVSCFLNCATHFYSTEDISVSSGNSSWDEQFQDDFTKSPERIVYLRIRIEYLHQLFDGLPEKEKDIFGRCYGVFGYPQQSLKEIGMFHLMKESAVEKARIRALQQLRESYSGSTLRLWDMIYHMLYTQ